MHIYMVWEWGHGELHESFKSEQSNILALYFALDMSIARSYLFKTQGTNPSHCVNNKLMSMCNHACCKVSTFKELSRALAFKKGEKDLTGVGSVWEHELISLVSALVIPHTPCNYLLYRWRNFLEEVLRCWIEILDPISHETLKPSGRLLEINYLICDGINGLPKNLSYSIPSSFLHFLTKQSIL